MVKLKRKRIKGHTYWYAVSQKRVNGKLIDEWQVYLGSAKSILEKIQGGGPKHVNIKSFEFGKVATILAIDEELQFSKTINDIVDKKDMKGLSVGEYVLVSVFGRWCGPLSKRATAKMFKQSFLDFYYSIPHKMNAQNIFNNLAYLTKNTIERISFEVSKRLIDLGLRPSILMWDTTNFTTNIQNGESLARKGKAKNKRFDKNIVGVGLAVSEDNIPFFHETYPGNIHDSKVLSESIDRIVGQIKALDVDPKTITVVMDKGNNSDTNIDKILEDIHVVGALKRDQVKKFMNVPLYNYKMLYVNEKGHTVRGWRTTLEAYGQGFTVVISHNEATEKRQRGTYLRYEQKFLEGIKDIKERYERKGGRGRPMSQSGAIRQIRALTSDNYPSVFKYDIGLEPKEIRYWIDDDAKKALFASFGKNAIFTDRHDLPTDEIVRIYNSKYQLENDFKLLKDKLVISLTPAYVRKDDSIRIHVFVCVTGLLFMRFFFWRMKDLRQSEKDLLEALEGIRVALVSTEDMKGAKMVVEEMTPLQARIFSRLDLGRFIDH